MKKFLYSMTSMLALFVANNALADGGYVCTESRVFTSCGKGFYLEETTAGSGIGTCEVCPIGFGLSEDPVVGKDNCVGMVRSGFYYNKESDKAVACPQGARFFCPGKSDIKYGDANQSTTTTLCYDSANPNAMTVGLKNVIGSSKITSLSFGTNGLPDGVKVITTKPVGATLPGQTPPGGSSSYADCAFDWNGGNYNYKVQIVLNNTLAPSSPATLNIVECGSGKLSSTRQVKFSDINVAASANPVYSSGCTGCGEGKYLPDGATACVDCDIHAALGLDSSVTATWRSGLADLDTGNFVCPYTFAELPVENGIATNVNCSMNSVADSTYSCSISLDYGQLGCAAGYVLQNADMASAELINCGGVSGSEQSVAPASGTTTVVDILTPGSLKCVQIYKGCYQPYDVEDFAEITDSTLLIEELLGEPCGGGYYCSTGGTGACRTNRTVRRLTCLRMKMVALLK